MVEEFFSFYLRSKDLLPENTHQAYFSNPILAFEELGENDEVIDVQFMQLIYVDDFPREIMIQEGAARYADCWNGTLGDVYKSLPSLRQMMKLEQQGIML